LFGGLFRGFGFELLEHRFGALDGFVGKASEFGDMDAIALVGASADDFAEEDDAVGCFLDGDLVIDSSFEFLF
jgi:hypothetical protein